MSIVLRGGLGTGTISNERFNVTFQHHNTMRTLRESALVMGCSICRALLNELEKQEELDVTADANIAIQAELTYLEDHDNLAFRRGSGDSTIYRLDFILEKEQLGSHGMGMVKVDILLRTFALKPTSKSIIQPLSWAYMSRYYVSAVCIKFGSTAAIIPFWYEGSARRKQMPSRRPSTSFLGSFYNI
jgi:hypothetical protein